MRRALVVALVTLGLAGRAHGFVRRLVADDPSKPVFWREGCVPVTIYLNGFDRSPNNHDLDVPSIEKSIVAAAHAWSSDGISCDASGDGPSFEIVPTLAPLDAKPPAVGYDAKNIVVFRLADWPYNNEALAKTTVTPSSDDGHILDVDIEINAYTPGQAWMNLDPGATPPPDPPHVSEAVRFFDLQAALTHEFGHFMGLMHTCFRPEDGAHLSNETGAPIKDCTDPTADRSPVMDPTIDPGQARQRALTGDDADGVCAIAGPAREATCALDTSAPGCATAAPPRPSRAPLAASTVLAGAAGLAALARRRRRARQRS
ncbi:MAG TPA: hypothetical protein VHL80_01725 [Polyangia bacterium]|nr:hypothetical protein [Polyangia bacterium]